ncbi:MAG: hypothetical protein JWL92_655 [Candidatus Nomurabacteria bacterium]|nr:hypothetical protein [Candidatus Nomurabacteria bacterium]
MIYFRKLKKGGIIFILKETAHHVHAIHFLSKTLRVKTYHPDEVEKTWNNIDEARDKFNRNNYPYDERCGCREDTHNRKKTNIQNMLFWQPHYAQTG